jgi:hypothetical protein
MDSSTTFSPDTPMLLLGAQSVALYVDHGECNYLLANPDPVAAALSVELCVRRMPHGSGVANVSAASAAERPASTLPASNATLRASFFCTPLNHSLIDLDNQFASDVYWSWVQVAPPPPAPPHSAPMIYCRKVVKFNVLSPVSLLPLLVPDVTFEAFTTVELELKVKCRSRNHLRKSMFLLVLVHSYRRGFAL